MNKDYIHKLSSIINEFNEHYISQHCNGLTLHGYYLTDKAPSTFKELVEYRHCNVLPVYAGGSDNTIYKHAYQNYNFRFVHDLHHIKLNKAFSFDGEMSTIKPHFEAIRKWSFKHLDSCTIRHDLLKLFLIDTAGQVEYYYQYGDYIKDQLSFAIEGMTESINKLAKLAGLEL